MAAETNPPYNTFQNGHNITYPGSSPTDVNGSRSEVSGGDQEGPVNSLAYMAGVGTVLTLLVFIAVVGNLLVVAAVFTDRRLKVSHIYSYNQSLRVIVGLLGRRV